MRISNTVPTGKLHEYNLQIIPRPRKQKWLSIPSTSMLGRKSVPERRIWMRIDLEGRVTRGSWNLVTLFRFREGGCYTDIWWVTKGRLSPPGMLKGCGNAARPYG